MLCHKEEKVDPDRRGTNGRREKNGDGFDAERTEWTQIKGSNYTKTEKNGDSFVTRRSQQKQQ